MARIKTDPVGQADIEDYLKTSSDFAFELTVLKQLNDLGFDCQHGGTYTDPVTNKDRAFDIRAIKQVRRRCFLRLAVECKNIRPNFPLLVHCVPRIESEAFHTVCVASDPRYVPLEKYTINDVPAMRARCKNLKRTGAATIYQAGHFVGKSCAQVGRLNDGDTTGSDSEVYDKWSQALASADDLTAEAAFAGEHNPDRLAISLVFPLLVIPDARLWVVEYDATGKQTSPPYQKNECPYYVDKSYYTQHANASEPYVISHIEYVTTGGLNAFVRRITDSADTLNTLYPMEEIFFRLNIPLTYDS